jgi:predicted nucleic acid-binding protein
MDSCCFIELALKTLGKHEAAREDDLWHLKELLNASFDGEIEVLTATLSIAECAHAKGDVSDDVKSLFKRFLTSGRYILLVQDSILVAERARNLRWVHGLALSGADAIHIASALELKCDEFLTWDNKLHANVTALEALTLPVRFPHDTTCLPMSYRQTQIPGMITGPIPVPALPADATPVPSNETPEEIEGE